jgi:cytochrome c oxidase subunit 2
MNKKGVWIAALAVLLAAALGFFAINKGLDFGMASDDESKDIGQGAQPSLEPLQSNSSAGIPDLQPSPREFDITARKWAFSPGTIKVSEGDTVTLKIRSVDVEHGFSLPAFGVNEDLSPGKEVEVTFVADKKGTYAFFCNVYCGSGHSEMSGSLVVE